MIKNRYTPIRTSSVENNGKRYRRFKEFMFEEPAKGKKASRRTGNDKSGMKR